LITIHIATKGIYIYGIIPVFYKAEVYMSLGNTGIYTIAYQNISVIISERVDISFDFSIIEEQE